MKTLSNDSRLMLVAVLATMTAAVALGRALGLLLLAGGGAS